METSCETCPYRDECKTTCDKIRKILKQDNRYTMEKYHRKTIMLFPKTQETHFSEITQEQIDKFSEKDTVPWSSTDRTLRKTVVFIERFFNGVSCKELAERFNVKENTIVCLYKQAVEQVEKIIDALDARREGLKAVKAPKQFTVDQKMFLLHHVFQFSQREISEMFNRDRNMVGKKIKRLADKYSAAFAGERIQEETPITDPPLKDKLSRPELVWMVGTYTEQGLSHRQAFKRIAERWGDHLGRVVSYRGIESKFYKTRAATAAA